MRTANPWPNARTASYSTRLFLLIVLLNIGWLSGCADPNANPFGAIEDYSRSSLNGLGAHKKLWEQAGAKCLMPKRLSRRLDSVDVIVLVAQEFDPPGAQAREWLENWLAATPGRTVVYFGRDFNAELFYLQKTIGTVPVDNLPQVRQRMALVKSSEMQGRLESYSENTFCGWFYLDTQHQTTEVTEYDGAWATQLAGKNSIWPLRTRLMPPNSSYRLTPPSWITNPKKTANPNPLAVNPNPTGTASSDSDEDKIVFRSQWEAEELKSQEQWDAEFENILDSQVLLQSSDNEPLVFRLQDGERLGQGKIIVVANGGPFLNGSLVDPMFGQVAEMIIEECMPASRVAFVAYKDNGLQVSLTDEIDSRGIGIEMLVEWPLSAITLSACLVGLVICIQLLPILGRPRSLREQSVSDFGMHVNALGQLLQDAGDQAYARRTIADYFVQVRKEPPPAWLTASNDPSDQSPLDGSQKS